MASESQDFWENRYREGAKTSSGRPSALLVQYAEGRTPGRALELGCGKGDDSVWLAGQGWEVTGTDVAEAALEIARANAEAAGVAGRMQFERHDLSQSFPEGRFDLVTACYFESPVDFGRHAVLRRAAEAIAPGGRLIVVAHGSMPPWVEAKPDRVFATVGTELAGLALDPADWHQVVAGLVDREARGPDGQRATIADVALVFDRKG